MAWMRILVGAVWLNGAVEKLLNPEFPRQFAQSLQACGFVSQAPGFFRAIMESVVVPDAEIFATPCVHSKTAQGGSWVRTPLPSKTKPGA